MQDFENPLVLEVGRDICKAGFAGEGPPRIMIPSGFPPYVSIISVQTHVPQLKGHEKGSKESEEEFWKGPVHNILEKVIGRLLHMDRVQKRRVVVLVDPEAPKALENTIVQEISSRFHAAAVLPLSIPLAACAACGKRQGLIIDIGYTECKVTPVADGQALVMWSTIAVEGGVKDILLQWKALLQKKAQWVYKDDVVDIKEEELEGDWVMDSLVRFVCASPTSEKENVQWRVDERGLGWKISVPSSVLWECVESVVECVAEAVIECWLRCTLDLRSQLKDDMLLIGGGCMIPGLRERLEEVVARLCQERVRFRKFSECVWSFNYPPFAPHCIAWMGGSVLGVIEHFWAQALVSLPDKHLLLPDPSIPSAIRQVSIVKFPLEEVLNAP